MNYSIWIEIDTINLYMEQILIKNFKAIVNKEDRPINVKKMTVLMGEQGSGKSTVAKLIYFFKTIREEILTPFISSFLVTEDNLKHVIEGQILSYFITLFSSSRRLSNFEITYTYTNGEFIRINQTETGELKIEFEHWLSKLNKAIGLNRELKRLDDAFGDLERRERDRFVNAIVKIVNNLFGSTQLNLYLPASRNAVISLGNHLLEIYAKLDNNLSAYNEKDAHKYMSENDIILLKFIQYNRFLRNKFLQSGNFQTFIEDEKELNPGLDCTDSEKILTRIEAVLKGRYLNDPEGEKLAFSNNQFVFLQNASSGQQESIRTFQDIFLHVLYGDPVFRVIEEPESHLFAAAQKELIESLAILANKNSENQLLITTHSTFILRVLDNLLKAFEIKTRDAERIIDRAAWLNFDEFAAYNLVNGEIEDALNQEFKGVDARLFDDVTQQISNEFDELLNIQYPSKMAKAFTKKLKRKKNVVQPVAV
ncbi:hypothetical protein Runsl_3098 [Runella slithyformis DSM 19594]|uniref:Endonuclease GajA/Old nuclease/RecF-like AAA domain-containing protein n=2 Tax=Runella TaxID=105 RepID=A0A7U4E6D4_RUNSL|nr:hypothetical protein Runsl_3098 [Runella slithyformis DSM 19594]